MNKYNHRERMGLKRRIERMERKVKPGELRAVIDGFVDDSGARGALPSDDPSLQEGVDEEGEAVISRWWGVWFFEGTREQQEARLKELRLDPEFQKPCSDDEIPLRFEGGARCEDVYSRLEEMESREKTDMIHRKRKHQPAKARSRCKPDVRPKGHQHQKPNEHSKEDLNSPSHGSRPLFFNIGRRLLFCGSFSRRERFKAFGASHCW